MSVVAHHTLLVAAAGALVLASLRAAAALGAHGTALPVAAAPIACAFAALSGMVLGLVGLGGSPVLLAGLAVAAGVAAWRLLPPLNGARPPRDVVLFGSLGAAAAWVAWLVRYPTLGIDPLTYHLPEAVRFVQQGTPGSVEEIVYEFPVGAYPLLNEVVVAWGTAIGSSFAFALLWTPFTGGLFALAGWSALRALDAPRRHAGLAVAAVLLVPIAVTQHHGPHTDLPALAWLAVAFALAVHAREAPRLLALAVLAFGLAIGTKTTVAPLGLGALALGAVHARRSLVDARRSLSDAPRSHSPPRRLLVHARSSLLNARGSAAVAAGVVLGGFWYVRNWVRHGSPLWPFPLEFPGADPIPPLLRSIDVSLLESPGRTLAPDRLGTYFDVLGGAPLVLLAAVCAPLVVRRRPVVLAGAATAVATLLWANAPFTGAPDDPVLDFSLNTTRYLLPAVASGALTLALARAHRVLALAVAVSLVQTQRLPFPGMPSVLLLVLGAAAGAALVRAPRKLGYAAPALAVAALCVIATGFAARHGGIPRFASGGLVSWFAAQPGDAPVASAPGMIGVLAGDRLQHELSLIPRDEPCPLVRARAVRGYVVIGRSPFPSRRAPFTAAGCLRDLRPVYEDPSFVVYRKQTASTSSASGSGASATKKSSGVIAAAAGGG